MKNKIKLLSLVVIVMVFLFCLCSCQSTNKKESSLDYSNLEQADFEYREDINRTQIIFNITLTNNTIYSFDSFNISLNLYSDSSVIDTNTYTFNASVRNGDTYTKNFVFYADGKIDSIGFVSWSANYNSIWETYIIWFIVSIILVSIAFVIYLIAMIINDWDFDDIAEFFENSVLVALILIIPFGAVILGIITSHWVPVLIVVGAVVTFVLLALLAHLIKHIISKL